MRLVGLSEVTVAQIEQARRVVEIVSVQNRYNLTDREWEDEVDVLRARGYGVHPLVPPVRRSAGRRAARWRVWPSGTGRRVYQIALAWLLAHSPAMLVIPGTSSVSHLEENIARGGDQAHPRMTRAP